MKNENCCLDFYGEKLKIGDEIIPIKDNENWENGFIFGIHYSKFKDKYYITIVDNLGNIIEKKAIATKYTTKKRYNEREKINYIYSLTFFNKSFWPEATLPLTNSTDYDYIIPDDTCFVALKANHLENKNKISPITNSTYTSYISSTIYYFIIDSKIKILHNDDNDFYYLYNPELYSWYPINNSYKVFEDKENLEKYVKEIIKYFNKADLSQINNNSEFNTNEAALNFEKRLIYKIKD